MIRLLVILLLTTILSFQSASQIIEPKEDALIEVGYTKTVSIDTIGQKYFHKSPMTLRVGKSSSMFFPDKKMFLDSLDYYDNYAGMNMILSYMMKGEPVTDIGGWEDEYIFRNVREDETFVCRSFATYHMGYAEKTLLPEWTIKPDSTRQLLGYECLYATTSFRGREWEAWFAPELPLKEGPWKLAGLPGIVLLAQDKNGQYLFEATSIRTENIPTVGIFIYNRKPLDMMKSREEYLKALYFLDLKGKFMNEVSVHTNFKVKVGDRIPLYDFEEVDYPHD